MFAHDVAPLQALVGLLGDVDPGPDPATIIDQVEALERVKSAAAAAQARLTAAFADTHRHARSEASTGAEVGLARRDSPHRGRAALTLARALVHDLPHTLAALERGDITEHRAHLVAAGTRDLTRTDRVTVDARLGTTIATLGDRDLVDHVARHVMSTDPHGTDRRRERARARRHLTTRRTRDGMALITATVTDLDAAAITASLQQRAAVEVATGVAEGRTHAQTLVDLFVERLTGTTMSTSVPVALSVVISAEALLGEGDEPADLPGHGPVPASVARALVTATDPERLSIRRLFRLEATDRLVAMDATTRTYSGLLAHLVRIRDRRCRTPWCTAPIRHLDHAHPHAAGGETTESNAQGLCHTCNNVKETPGWRHHPPDDPLARHDVQITTPTGHHHTSCAPTPPRGQRWTPHPRHPHVWTLTA